MKLIPERERKKGREGCGNIARAFFVPLRKKGRERHNNQHEFFAFKEKEDERKKR